MNADWFYSVGETRQGPVAEDDLKRLAVDGKLKPSDLVWRDGMPDWVEARTVSVLFPPRTEQARGDFVGGSPYPDDDDRPSARERRRRYDDDDADRPSRRARRRDEYDDDVDDRRPTRRRDHDDRDDDDVPRSRSKQKPGQIQAVAIMMLCGGIWGILYFLGFAGATVCFGLLWPVIWLELVVSILAIVRASNMLGRDDQGPPKTLAILFIICILNGDLIVCVLGIICLVMLSDQQVQAYYRKKGFY